MNDPIFAIPRTYYGSYQDELALIDLSGFDKIFIDEIDALSDNIYIITVRNDEIGGGFPGAKARIILWDLEYRREPQAPILGVPEVWHMDAPQAELIGAKYVPIGGHPGLKHKYSDKVYTNYRREDTFDVAYLAYMTHRRQHVYNDLQARGVRLSPTSAWGDDRNAILNASRVYLHVHQHDDIPAVPGLRLVVAAAYKLPVISEHVADAGVFDKLFVDITAPLDYIGADIADYWLKSAIAPELLVMLGDKLHQFLCVDYTFRRSVEEALS